jgi:hypothetical protein
MITAIFVGVLSGVAGFTLCMIAFAFATKGDKATRKWLEPYWQKSNINETKQANALTRIAIALQGIEATK